MRMPCFVSVFGFFLANPLKAMKITEVGVSNFKKGLEKLTAMKIQFSIV